MTELSSAIQDGVALMTLRAGRRRNALTLPMVAEIAEELDRLEADDSVGAVVITGEPPAFCAGADLGDLGTDAETVSSSEPTPAVDRARETQLRAIYEGFLRVARSPLPTVAAVNGAAVGAGINLALACDVRLAARRARFDTRFMQLGLHPGGGHTWMLQRIVGPQAAAALVLFGEVLDGEAAAACGLAWRCVDDDSLVEEALAFAGRAAAAPRGVVMRAKQTLRTVASIPDRETAVDVELDAQLWSIAQPEFIERLRSLRRKVQSAD